jgi:hypothetical protein
MFIDTLDVSDFFVRSQFKKVRVGSNDTTSDGSEMNAVNEPQSAIVAPVRKVGSGGKNRTTDELLESVRKHINKYPRMDSHYRRAESQCEYLEPGLSLKKMYKQYCSEMNDSKPVKIHIYRKIFNYEFNIRFHHPLNDQCATCTSFELLIKAMGTVSAEEQKKQDDHISRKDEARQIRNNDKTQTAENVMVSTMDLQQVQLLPKVDVGPAYYLRKLDMFNFTIYQLKDHVGHCYAWSESEGEKGANEISSWIFEWLKDLDNSGKYTSVIMFSDTCSGQNRNQFLSSMIIYFLSHVSVNIKVVEEKYFESGHSQMECDSMHSTIQRNVKHKAVYSPHEYVRCIETARTSQPYIVNQKYHDDITDWKCLATGMLKNGAFSGIMQAKRIKYCHSENDVDVFFFANNAADTVGEQKMWRKPGRRPSAPVLVKKLKARGIVKAKKNDLVKLLQYIPRDFHPFYKSLPIRKVTGQNDDSDDDFVGQ